MVIEYDGYVQFDQCANTICIVIISYRHVFRHHFLTTTHKQDADVGVKDHVLKYVLFVLLSTSRSENSSYNSYRCRQHDHYHHTHHHSHLHQIIFIILLSLLLILLLSTTTEQQHQQHYY